MDTKNVAKTEKITLKCHYKRETHVNDTTKNRKNENIFTFQLSFLPYFPYLFTIQSTFYSVPSIHFDHEL